MKKGTSLGRTCKIPGCTNKHQAKGMCASHYMKKFRWGDPLVSIRRKKGTGCVLPSGYKLITVGSRRVQEHRYLMEQHLGRPLKKSEYIHHKNFNASDNRIENLQIVTSSEHTKIHLKHRWKTLGKKGFGH